MQKKVSLDIPNVRHEKDDEKNLVLNLALESDESTIKVSVGGSQGCKVYVRAKDLIEAVHIFEAAVGTPRLANALALLLRDR